MFNIFGFRSLKAELFCISVLLVVLVIILISEYWQKKLEKKRKDMLHKELLETALTTDTDDENYNIYKK